MILAALRPQCGRERENTRENTGRDGATEALLIGGSEPPIEVAGLAKYPSHGGSQGFKSPHLHPQHRRSARRQRPVGGAHRVPGPRWGRERPRNSSTTAALWSCWPAV